MTIINVNNNTQISLSLTRKNTHQFKIMFNIKLKIPYKTIIISNILFVTIWLLLRLFLGPKSETLILFTFFCTWIFSLPSLFQLKEGTIDNSKWGDFKIKRSDFNIISLISLFKFKENKTSNTKWSDFNIMSLINLSVTSIICFLLMLSFVYKVNKDLEILLVVSFIIPLSSGMVISSIIGIFLEKSSNKTKVKRLISILLLVWTIYKLITSFLDSDESESESVGIDTDGDGVKDSFDTDGDGVMDTSFVDTDGDGVSDTIAIDTDGDGLIDTVYSDTDGDGKIDSFIKDIDGDGISDIGILDTNGDGKPDKLV